MLKGRSHASAHLWHWQCFRPRAHERVIYYVVPSRYVDSPLYKDLATPLICLCDKREQSRGSLEEENGNMRLRSSQLREGDSGKRFFFSSFFKQSTMNEKSCATFSRSLACLWNYCFYQHGFDTIGKFMKRWFHECWKGKKFVRRVLSNESRKVGAVFFFIFLFWFNTRW